MKHITFVRHGKSSWELDVIDSERPLKPRGKSDAKLVVNHFIKHGKLPNRIFSSPAKRALKTCKIFAKQLDFDKNKLEVINELYDFGGENVVSFIKNLSNSYNDVMIFGHNHALTSISNIFGSTFIDNLPTSGLVRISFKIDDWKDLKKGETEFIIIPKELK